MSSESYIPYYSEIERCARLGYTPERIASILKLRGTKRAIFLLDIIDSSSEIYSIYVDAVVSSEFELDEKLHGKAIEGDLDSLEIYEERRVDRKFLELRKNMFGV